MGDITGLGDIRKSFSTSAPALSFDGPLTIYDIFHKGYDQFVLLPMGIKRTVNYEYRWVPLSDLKESDSTDQYVLVSTEDMEEAPILMSGYRPIRAETENE